jgi:replicative DNA helicase
MIDCESTGLPVALCGCDDCDAPAATTSVREPSVPVFLFKPGGDFVLDASDKPEPLWGDGPDVLWSKGEGLIVTGGIGAGKTTMLGHLVRASLGLQGDVVGYPVVECPRVLYIAADRPQQIARNMRRLFTEADRGRLNDRLAIMAGPPPGDIAATPPLLLNLCRAAGLEPGDRVFIDSAKDVALNLSSDETGAGWNQAQQLVIAAGIDLAANHHQRKAQGGKNAMKPKSLSDLYGSTWIGAGAGTVVLLWPEEPGSAFVELSMLKSAADDVGPVMLLHDLDSGSFAPIDATSAEDFLRATAHTCHSIKDVLRATGALDTRGNVEQLRRRLHRLEKAGLVRVVDHRPTAVKGTPASFYQWAGEPA